MSELKTVYSKLFKTELASHKVDLSVIDDFNKLGDSYFIQSGKFEDAVQKIEIAIKSMQTEFIALEKTASAINNEYGKAKKLSLDLGVELPKEIENEYKRVLAILKNDLATFKKYNAVTR
jgi:hypothetical protein